MAWYIDSLAAIEVQTTDVSLGSFLEYVPTIPFLTTPTQGSNGRNVSYNVVIPSLPGFGFSSLPSTSWNPDDTARLFNSLMVDVLGYSHYTAYGSDFVSGSSSGERQLN
jgi:hypothetical protein